MYFYLVIFFRGNCMFYLVIINVSILVAYQKQHLTNSQNLFYPTFVPNLIKFFIFLVS